MHLFFFTPYLKYQKITALETYSARHAILRKGKPLSTCQFDGDDLESTHHFSFF
jgi:hypothetical protein